MKKPAFIFSVIVPVFLIVFFFQIKISCAQDSGEFLSDSVQADKIDMADLSIKSTDAILELKKMSDRLIEDDILHEMKRKNRTLLLGIDSLLRITDNIDLEHQTTRQLDNNLIFWNQQLNLVEDEMSNITSVIHDLDEKIYSLSTSATLWKNTQMAADENEMPETAGKRIDEVLYTIDTTLTTINNKVKITLELVNSTSKLELDIETWIDRIKGIIQNKQHELFKTNQRSLFTLDYFNTSNWNVLSSAKRFFTIDVKNLGNFLIDNIGTVIFHIVLIALLIFLFISIRKAHMPIGKNEASVYKKRFKVLLSRPIASALIFGLFASVVLYQHPPLIFLDLMRFIVIFPIIIVLISVLHKRYHIYVYALGFVWILQLIYINLSTENIVSRYILFIMALIEGGALFHFIREYRGRKEKKYKYTRFILLLAYVHLGMVAAGLIGDIIGKVMLAEYFLFSVIGNALAGILIALVLIIINGLTVLFIDSKYTDNINVIKQNRLLIIQKATRIFNILAGVLLIYYILKIAGWETIVIDGLTEWFTIDRSIGSMVFSWWGLVIFFLVIWLSVMISNILKAILEIDVLNKMKLKTGLPHTIALMVKYTLVTLGVFMAVSAAGIPFSEFAIIFGAFGVGIGFGLQNIFNNLVSGFILLFERPIKIGDTIEVGTLMGNVKSIGIRSSNVRTFDGAEIIVPNGNLISNEVVNWTLSDQTRRIEVIVGVSYSSDPHKVHDILLKVLKDHQDIVKYPEPNVFFKELGDSSLNFRLLCWTPQFDQWIRIKSEILFAVFDELKAAGIEIPFPQRDLHVRSIEPNIEIKKL